MGNSRKKEEERGRKRGKVPELPFSSFWFFLVLFLFFSSFSVFILVLLVPSGFHRSDNQSLVIPITIF